MILLLPSPVLFPGSRPQEGSGREDGELLGSPPGGQRCTAAGLAVPSAERRPAWAVAACDGNRASPTPPQTACRPAERPAADDCNESTRFQGRPHNCGHADTQSAGRGLSGYNSHGAPGRSPSLGHNQRRRERPASPRCLVPRWHARGQTSPGPKSPIRSWPNAVGRKPHTGGA
jgi:hypothetical protein